MKLLRGEIKEAEREKRTAERGARFTRGCDARNKVRKGRSPEIDLHAVGEHLPRPTSLLLPFRRSRRLKKKKNGAVARRERSVSPPGKRRARGNVRKTWPINETTSRPGPFSSAERRIRAICVDDRRN
mgnify:CR=1 FL=1